MIQQFTLPIHEKVSANAIYSGKHWSFRNRIATDYHNALLPYKDKFHVKSFPVKVTYSFRWKGVALDTSNCSFLVKVIEDGMVGIGLLPSDAPGHVAQTTIRSKRGKHDEVLITIEPFV
jgi:hypothetical protein